MKAAQRWQIFLEELDWWAAEHEGSTWAPHNAISRDVAGRPYLLGQRLAYCRRQYANGKLAPEQIRDLEQRPGWIWDGVEHSRAEVWNEHYRQVRGYFVEHTTLRNLEAQFPSSARWLREQRTVELPTDRRERLEQIPGALTTREQTTRWFVRAVEAWLDEEPGRTIDGLRNGTVQTLAPGQMLPIGRQARYYRRRYAEGRLDKETVDLIEAISGWFWVRQPSFEDALVSWLEDVPGRTPADLRRTTTHTVGNRRVALGHQAAYVRSKFADGTLSREVIDALEAIDGWSWTPRSSAPMLHSGVP